MHLAFTTCVNHMSNVSVDSTYRAMPLKATLSLDLAFFKSEGVGVLSIITLYLRFFKVKGVKTSPLVAFALLLVTGLDILPALLFLVLFKCHLVANLPPSMEWWNDQVDGWLSIGV